MSSLRSLAFMCTNGHEYEELRSFESIAAIPDAHDGVCKCGEPSLAFNITPGHAPSIGGGKARSRRSGGISEGEALQARAQFGVTPTTRDELNGLLKQHGKVAVSDSEFNALMEHTDAVQEKQKKEPYTAQQKEKRRDAMIRFQKDRRTWFRSQYDAGAIPKSVPVDSEVASAKADVTRDPLG